MTSILDATAGSRMMWFNKRDSRCIYLDQRKEKYTLCDGRTLVIEPDVQADFRKMPFRNDTFNLVVFDPPHLERLGESSWTNAKYGTLLPNWEEVITDGFTECFRVLKPGGTLIFKWNESQIPVKRILDCTPHKPLFGHKSGRQSKTHWITFTKEQK